MKNFNDQKSEYKSCEDEKFPQAEVYVRKNSNSEETLNGIPLYPDDICANSRYNRFVVRGYQDLWAALLFVALVILTVVWGFANSTINTDQGTKDNHVDNAGDLLFSIVTSFWTMILFFVLGSIGACTFLLLLRLFPSQIIYIANVATVAILFSVSVVLLASGVVIAGLFLLFSATIQLIWLFSVRQRIPFASTLLRTSTDVLTQYRDMFLYYSVLAVSSFVFLRFWGAMTFSTLRDPEYGGGSSILILFFVFILFWFFQVIPNLMHVTTAGVTATWYFAGENQMPPNPAFHSFKRATTTSFGSVCFGSLIVAFVRVFRWLAQTAGEHQNEFIRCITVCILQCLENLIEYFNTYAFVHVAVYGCSYIEAAKRTWALCKECGFAAYFNDVLISATLGFLMIAISSLIGTVVGLMAQESTYGFVAFFISLIINDLVFTAVESAVVTIFVCFAEVPDALQESSPLLYAALISADQNVVHNSDMRL